MRTISREEHIKDLQWYFFESESACGISSTYSAFIAACKYSTSHQDEIDLKAFSEMCVNTTTAYDILAATRKNRRILNVYQGLSSKDKIVLEAYYQERKYDLAVSSDFGPGVGLIPYTAIGQKMSRIALQNYEGSNLELRRMYTKNKEALKKQVDQLWSRAIDNYIELANKETR